jgi:hypothetical protein
MPWDPARACLAGYGAVFDTFDIADIAYPVPWTLSQLLMLFSRLQ